MRKGNEKGREEGKNTEINEARQNRVCLAKRERKNEFSFSCVKKIISPTTEKESKKIKKKDEKMSE